MRCVDVNVLVYAHRPESPQHDSTRDWLDNARRGPELLAVPTIVASGFLRIVTHPRVFREPTPTSTAVEFIEALVGSSTVSLTTPSSRHWGIFTNLCTTMELRGNAVPDAYLAAMAIESGATFVTADRGFSRFPGLRMEHPSAP